MKILFMNDTGNEANPGCRAVSSTIVHQLLPESEVIRLPLNYWAKEFVEIEGVRKRCVQKRKGFFPIADEVLTKVDVSRWEQNAKSCLERDTELQSLLSQVDGVVVNGEGSIHHNFPRALSLLALCYAADQQHLPLFLVNSSLMSMDVSLLDRALGGAKKIVVRGEASRTAIGDLLRKKTEVSPDFAFAGEFRSFTFDSIHGASDNRELQAKLDLILENPAQYCLFAPGVASTESSARECLAIIRDRGLSPLYLQVGDSADNGLIEILHEKEKDRLDVLNLADIDWQSLPDLFSRFTYMISGRHHLNIFAYLGGLPCIALPSNTWKIEETIEQLDTPIPIVDSPQTLEELLRSDQRVHSDRRHQIADHAASTRERTKNVLEKLQETISQTFSNKETT